MMAAAYFAAGALGFGVALDDRARLPLRWVGWLASLLCAAGLVYEVAR